MKPSAPPPGRPAPAPAGRALALALLLAGAPAAQAAAPPPALLQAAGLVEQDGLWRLPGCASDLKPDVEWHDLDGDGRPEAALFLAASRCRPEHPGGSVGLYARAGEAWRVLLPQVQGVELVPQAGREQGWRHLGIATAGGCMPLYRWDGQAYRPHGQKAIQPGGCALRE